MVDLEQLEAILGFKSGATKEFPFTDDVMVFKVKKKMFALIRCNEIPLKINLKCDPIDALAYRDIYECVAAGYHMSKKHWNTITLDGTMKNEILIDMIDSSYDLVVEKLTKKEQKELLLA